MKTRAPRTIPNTYSSWKEISKSTEPIKVEYSDEELAVIVPIELWRKMQVKE